MTAGSVTVDHDESYRGSGMALAIFTADVATLSLPAVPTLGSTAAPWNARRPVSQDDVDVVKAGRLSILRERARQATANAAGIVAHIQANATAGGDPVT